MNLEMIKKDTNKKYYSINHKNVTQQFVTDRFQYMELFLLYITPRFKNKRAMMALKSLTCI
jgi:hypothetical protein